MKSKYNNIYVLAPYNYATGGVELAHQLVDYLRNNNQNAYIVYMIGKDISDRQDITQAYSKYNIKSTAIIEDTLNNILILPEIYFEKILIYKNIQIGCWWMSVDNHYKNSEFCLYDKIINEKNIPYTRIIEHKHFEMFGSEIEHCQRTVISKEYSTEWQEGMEPYYPVNDKKNNEIYQQYKKIADKESNVIFGGRLAEYKYYDMAPIIEQVLKLNIFNDEI